VDQIAYTLTTRQTRNNLSAETYIPFIPFNNRHQGQRIYDSDDKCCTLSSIGGGWGVNTGLYRTIEGIRRLTPLECERVMGLPDRYTAIAYKGKPASDTARYRVIGQSMPVPVIRWLGERIEFVCKSAETAYIGE
jgi:DNA (cytosine-5)-methyltransferase 1